MKPNSRQRVRPWRLSFGRAFAGSAVLTAGLCVGFSSGTAIADSVSSAPAVAVSPDTEQAIAHLGSQYASAFGGLEMVEDRTHVLVYLTDPNPTIEAAFQAVAGAGVVSFRTTPRSADTVAAIHDRLQASWPALTAQGIELAEFGPDIERGQEDVGVVDLTASESQTLSGMFDTGDLHIYNVSPSDASQRVVAVSRTDDTAPYNGGDNIVNASHDAGCSSGFGVTIGGNPRLLTAGHCYTVGRSIQNYRCIGTDPNKSACSSLAGSGASMGGVTKNDLVYNQSAMYYDGVDTAVFSGCNGAGTCGGSRLIFRGPIGSSYTDSVGSTIQWQVGDQVCMSGGYGGGICSDVTAINHCYLVGGEDFNDYSKSATYHLCNETETHNSSQCPLHQGDSGGPVFEVINSTVRPVGTISANDCPLGYNSAGYGYFAGINAILDVWNATIITN